MNYQKLQLLLTPILQMVFGLILVFNPDFASAAIARALGWVIMAMGVVCIISLVLTKANIPGKVLFALVCFAIAGWLLRYPLRLAAAIGRIIGLLLTVRGVEDLMTAHRIGADITWSLINTAVGILLILLPMTTSRLVMIVCGLLLVLLGVTTMMNRLKKPGNPTIIDV